MLAMNMHNSNSFLFLSTDNASATRSLRHFKQYSRYVFLHSNFKTLYSSALRATSSPLNGDLPPFTTPLT